MADEADISGDRMEQEDLARARRWQTPKPYEPPPGIEGDCELCGEWSGRLVGGACSPCRDKHNLP